MREARRFRARVGAGSESRVSLRMAVLAGALLVLPAVACGSGESTPRDVAGDDAAAIADSADAGDALDHGLADGREDVALDAADVLPDAVLDPAGDPSLDPSTDPALDAPADADAFPVDATDVGIDIAPPSDRDHDGLSDDDEVIYQTNPDDPDTDDDGLLDGVEVVLHSDPRDPDTDRDGIPDGQEYADGTDPTDPSSARAWHPEWTERPRLFFGPGDVAMMRARTAAADGPWAALWARIRGAADAAIPSYPAGPYDQDVAMALGTIAENAAARGLLAGDPTYTAKALAALAVPFPDPSDLAADSDYDLREAETLVPMCIGYDLAAGTEGVDATALAAARANLVQRIDTYRWMGHEGSVAFMLLSSRNNHVMKFFAALGICALAINDRPEAASDLSEAMTGLDWMMSFDMSTEEGAWGEGWNYLVYGGRSYVPFMVAYHRWAQGRLLPYFGVPALQPAGTSHSGRVDIVEDFATNLRARAVYLRALWSLQPDGRTPNTDDANPEVLPGGMLAALFDDARFLYAWFRPSDAGFPDQGSPTAAFATYDGTPPPADPGVDPDAARRTGGAGQGLAAPLGWPVGRDGSPAPAALPLEGSAPDAGFAIFRTSWAADAGYLVLQGEHGTARSADPGHEHPDELSFLLWHGGRPLLIDPGYINYDQHELVRAAEDHNVILVDGLGSPIARLAGYPTDVGVDAFLDPMATESFVTSTRVVATYRGVAFTRRVARVAGRFFVVEDRMDGGGASHAYTWLLNGLGGGDVPDSDYTASDDGGTWRNGTAQADVRVLSMDGDAARDSDLQEHCTVWGQWAMHQRMKVTATMGTPAGFFAVVLPTGAGETAPTQVLVARHAPGVAAAVWTDGDTTYAAYGNVTTTPWTTGIQDGFLSAIDPGLTLARLAPGMTEPEVIHLAP